MKYTWVKRFIGFTCGIVFVFALVFIVNTIPDFNQQVKPDYPKIDITTILTKKEFSKSDYKTLFLQTGLGETAVDALQEDSATFKNKMLRFQETFFKADLIHCEKIGIITHQDTVTDSDNKDLPGFDFAPFENGYVFITKATHSIGWRHGHAAIVTDADNDEVLEATILGQNSQIQSTNYWRQYPTFIMLKLKDSSKEQLGSISKFALDNLYDIPYRMTTGIFFKKNAVPDNLCGTQCAHLIWYPFKQFGYDVDSDGSWLVTPDDILKSDLFEVVQVYGVDAKKFLKR